MTNVVFYHTKYQIIVYILAFVISYKLSENYTKKIN